MFVLSIMLIFHNKYADDLTAHRGRASLRNAITCNIPDSKVHGAKMGPIWARQDPGGSHVGPMNFAIWDIPGPTWKGSIEMVDEDIVMAVMYVHVPPYQVMH